MRASSLLLPLLPGAWAQLDSLAKAAGMTYFGTAVDNPSLNDTAYTAILSNTSEFGALTPLNGQKWNAIEPSQGNFTYGLGDAITNLAGKNNQLVRCQVLLYNNQLPDWVANGNWTNSTLVSAMQNHISNQVGHYKGQCYAWDVVKEAFLDDGSYRSDIFYNVIGEWYIPIAFQAAASADPDAKLYYNDYGIETPGPKTTAVQNLVKTLQAAGTKIDGVGFQSHFIVGSTPSKDDQISNLKSFADMGIDVALTELDVRMVLPSTSDLLNQQSQDYQSSIAACVVVVGCVGVTVWDFDDKYSWVPAAFTGFGAADLFDENLNRKPAYQGAVAALLSSNSSSSGNGTYNYIASNGTTITASLINPTAPPYPTGSGSGAGAGNAANRAGNGTVTTASAPPVPTASISAAERDSWSMASWGGVLVVLLGALLF